MRSFNSKESRIANVTHLSLEGFRRRKLLFIGRIARMTCDTCGVTFTPNKPWQKRCSKACRLVANNNNRRTDLSMKTCRSCRIDRPRENFRPAQRSCIECEDLQESGKKRCGLCREVKDVSQFHRRSIDSQTYDYRCKACRSTQAKERNTRPESRDRYRDLRYRRLYGATAAEIDAMAQRQQGLCAICKQEFPESFRVDHDHSTGRVRGLLCHNCNVLLGHCSESVDVLTNAILYLKENAK